MALRWPELCNEGTRERFRDPANHPRPLPGSKLGCYSLEDKIRMRYIYLQIHIENKTHGYSGVLQQKINETLGFACSLSSLRNWTFTFLRKCCN